MPLGDDKETVGPAVRNNFTCAVARERLTEWQRWYKENDNGL